MEHESWSAFFAMGGYAIYVWPSYALAAIVLILNVVAPIVRHKRLRRELKRRLGGQREVTAGMSHAGSERRTDLQQQVR